MSKRTKDPSQDPGQHLGILNLKTWEDYQDMLFHIFTHVRNYYILENHYHFPFSCGKADQSIPHIFLNPLLLHNSNFHHKPPTKL